MLETKLQCPWAWKETAKRKQEKGSSKWGKQTGMTRRAAGIVSSLPPAAFMRRSVPIQRAISLILPDNPWCGYFAKLSRAALHLLLPGGVADPRTQLRCVFLLPIHLTHVLHLPSSSSRYCFMSAMFFTSKSSHQKLNHLQILKSITILVQVSNSIFLLPKS